jgi:hypothetical protein
MEPMILVSVLLLVPGMPLVYLAARLMAVAVKLFRTGSVAESLLLLVVSIVAATFVAKFGNEKAILVAALLSWFFLAAAAIRYLLGSDEDLMTRKVYRGLPCNDGDPNSLTFSGVGPGFQGFGMYAHGVRVGNEPIDDDSY